MIRLTVMRNPDNILIVGPTRWSEVTVGLYQKVMREWDKSSRVQLICLLYDLQIEWINNSKDIKLISVLEQASAFWYLEPMISEKQEVIIIDDKPVVVPLDVKNYSIGQAIECRQSLEGAKTYDEVVSISTAIYLQPEYDGDKFSMERARELEKKILLMPVMEVHGTGFFLLQTIEQAWQQANERLSSIKIPGSDQDEFIAQASGVQDLATMADLSIIDKYAQTYMLDPDYVYESCAFVSVMQMFLLWKKRELFQTRFDNMKKILTPAS